MSLEAWVGLLATVGTALLSIAVAVWLEFRKRRTSGEGTAPSAPAVLRLDRVRAAGVLRAGVVHHPPLSWVDHSGGEAVFGGYYIDLARRVGLEQGLEVEFVALDWGVLPNALDDGGVDLVLSIFETRARLGYADFVAAFHKIGVSGVTREGPNPIREVAQLSEPTTRVGVVVGEVGWEFVVHELRLPRHQIVQVDSGTLKTAFSPLLSGDADVAIVDDVTCATWVRDHPGYLHVFTENSLYLCKNSIMVPKGEPHFARWVDDVFQQARRDPEIMALEEQTLELSEGWVKRFR
ncbi:substrate-binding periplasmic protein [Compostimonas suwonensis]|uniref:ABC-type amino acid transport substrate-binding protein n=1 Tax=Compostimonas suwonensis TaxID=1048394 RepID=A0A2M9BYK1_9MICO|nr:transporter substrate-binding domain-containing protein [Compostimonas suwonensis]PJJ63163.1 ABC-type amino acid transport substrate-binding protein [Compostimonas suwonensis]